MAKVKRETTRMKAEVHSREGKIAALVGNGLGNSAIWAAMEEEYPSIIETGDDRRNTKHKRHIKGIPAFDKDERAKVSRAINSTRGLEIKADEELRGVINLVGGDLVDIQSPDDIELTNRHRFSFGEPAMNYIYGETKFIHLSDSPDSKYRKEKRTMNNRDANGVLVPVETEVKVWKSGSWRIGDPMIPLNDKSGFVSTRDKDGALIGDLDLKRQIIEAGCPESFISVWGGEYGAGKSRLAVMISKGVNAATRMPVLYINGEATEEDMRAWLGHDVDPNLFKLVNADMLPIQRIMDFAKRLRPRLIVIDSIQTIAEMNKGNTSVKSTLAILKMMKASHEYGKPHIILISQLNAQGKLKGGTTVPHIADAVAHVRKMANKKGMFIFEIPQKNRGGETQRGATFRHTDTTVECVNVEMANKPIYNLIQPTMNPVLQAGVVNPPAPASEAPATLTTAPDETSQSNEVEQQLAELT